MTITYTGRVANARMFAFSRLLFCWKGSIYKLIYKEMLIFCVLYSFFSLIYRFALTVDQKTMFEKMVLHCEAFTSLIPLSFVLGFYVSIIITRWWNQYLNIPWPDRVMMYVNAMIEGVDERSRILRRTLMRYLTLSSLIVFQATSVVVKKRFPTMEHLVDAGVITLQEVQAMDEVNTPHGKWWVPIVWACNLIRDARKTGKISDNYCLKTLLDEVHTYRGQLGMLYSYDWISVPLVYTQVTTLAVYTFFLGAVFGRQFLDPTKGYPGHEVDLIVPIFTLLQFFFYMGWLKVAEQLINPFGEDDDDFNINWVIDRNMQVSLLVVDDMHTTTIGTERDIYFGDSPPEFLPYTKSSISSLRQPYMGSTADLSVSDVGRQVVSHMTPIPEDNVLDSTNLSPYGVVSHPSSPLPCSPSKSRRIQNMVHGLRTPLAGSKASIDNCSKLSASEAGRCFLNLGLPLNGIGMTQRNVVDGLVSEPASHAATPVGGLYLSRSPFERHEEVKSSRPNSPCLPEGEKTQFEIDMEEKHTESKPTSLYDIKNPDVLRVKMAEGASCRFQVTEVSDSEHLLSKLENESKIVDTAPASPHPVLRPLIKDGNSLYQRRVSSFRKSSLVDGPPSEESVSVDVPEICVETYSDVSKSNSDALKCENSNNTKESQSSSSSCSSGTSNHSLSLDDSHESSQGTITSLTPLLPDA